MRMIYGILAGMLTLNAAGHATAAPLGEIEFSTSLTVVSDYVYRGVSQTNGEPAWQLGLDWSAENGLYAGAWASRVAFEGDDETLAELDLYAGWSGAIGEASFDGSVLFYFYPSDRGDLNYDYLEFAVRIVHPLDDAEVGLTFSASPDGSVDSGPSFNVGADFAWPLGEHATILVGAGYQWIDDEAAYGLPDYADVRVELSYDLEPVTLQIGATWTDIPSAVCGDVCDARIWAGISYAI